MKKQMMTTMAALAIFGFASVAEAVYPAQDPSIEVSENTLELLSNNTATSTNTSTRTDTDTKTISSSSERNGNALLSNNSSTETNTSERNGNALLSNNTSSNTDTYTKNITNTSEKNGNSLFSNNTSTDTDTKTFTSTSEKNGNSLFSNNTSNTNITKNIAKAAEDNAIAVVSSGAVNITSTVLDVSKGGDGVLATGASVVNIASVTGGMPIEEVSFGAVGAEGEIEAFSRGNHGGTHGSNGLNVAFTGDVADGVGINTGNLYQVSNNPAAFAVSGSFTTTSNR